jgi:hypothetical protein
MRVGLVAFAVFSCLGMALSLGRGSRRISTGQAKG